MASLIHWNEFGEAQGGSSQGQETWHAVIMGFTKESDTASDWTTSTMFLKS